MKRLKEIPPAADDEGWVVGLALIFVLTVVLVSLIMAVAGIAEAFLRTYAVLY